ncbi:MAG: pyruvate kinase, partial [Verrucomicrobia bacterium]
KKVYKNLNRPIAIMMDIKGPEIRTGEFQEAQLTKGELLDLTITTNLKIEELNNDTIKKVSINYPEIINDVHINDTILVDNGLIQLKIIEKHKDYLRCEVLTPGLLKSNRHVNLPGIKINLPPLTDKDKKDLIVAIEENIDFIALSFVRESNDIIELKNYLKEFNYHPKIIAKVENQSGIDNIDSIIAESDAIMIARGDLGIECPYEKLPLIQRQIINKCIDHYKPVIVATHMLESMIHAPVPTRAEVTDISNAVFEQADCIMLSAETSIGQYPLECISVMKTISLEIEAASPRSYRHNIELHLPKNKMLRSAVVLAQQLKRACIIVFSHSGASAQLISSLRPTQIPIFVFTDSETTFKQMRILWGIQPYKITFNPDRNITINNALQELINSNIMQKDDYAVILTNIIVDQILVETIQLRRLIS